MVLMNLSPLSDACSFTFPHVLVSIIRISCCSKPDSGVTAIASVSVVPNKTNSCSGSARFSANSIETFFVAVELQGGLGANQRLPRVMAQ